MQEITYPSSDGKSVIHAYVWHAYDKPVGIVQIIHGMSEHALRYSAFAEYLAENGFIVCAADLLGHGKSVTDEDALGYFSAKKGYKVPYEDICKLAQKMKGDFPGMPYFMLGHSMGSFFCRRYMADFGGELSGAVLLGTGSFKGGDIRVAKLTTRTIALFKGWDHRSKFIYNLVFGEYNKKFEGRTPFDWLSSDKEQVDAYISDRLCGTLFTCNGFFGLFDLVGSVGKGAALKAVPDRLPVLILSGEQDPAGGYGKGVEKFYKNMEKRKKRVKIILYKDCRHEILNDSCADMARQDVLSFLISKAKK